MKLNIGFFWDPPWIEEKWQKDRKPGIFVEYLKLICSSLKADCRYSNSDNVDYGYYDNGSWHGLIREIADGIFDISVPNFTPSLERLEIVDFSDVVYRTPLILVTKATEQSDLSLSNLMGFHWIVWICFLLTCALIAFYFTIVEISCGKRNLHPAMIKGVKTCVDTCSFISNQSQNSDTVYISLKLVITLWALMATVIGGAYSSFLLSNMLRMKSDPPFKDFETFIECVEMKKCRLATNELSLSHIKEIFTSDTDTFERLRKALRNNPIIEMQGKVLLDRILKSKSEYITWYTEYSFYMALTESNKNCLYAKVNTPWSDTLAFPLTKNSTIKKYLNAKIALFNEMHVIQKLYNNYVRREYDCKITRLEGTQPITLTSIIGLFLVLFGGSLLSVIVFVYELCLRAYCRHQMRHKREHSTTFHLISALLNLYNNTVIE